MNNANIYPLKFKCGHILWFEYNSEYGEAHKRLIMDGKKCPYCLFIEGSMAHKEFLKGSLANALLSLSKIAEKKKIILYDRADKLRNTPRFELIENCVLVKDLYQKLNNAHFHSFRYLIHWGFIEQKPEWRRSGAYVITESAKKFLNNQEMGCKYIVLRRNRIIEKSNELISVKEALKHIDKKEPKSKYAVGLYKDLKEWRKTQINEVTIPQHSYKGAIT